uniref:uncharacterized protein LOC122604302 n=1 Tax=Erigeron canadensis TaxID=72917 RepID=UPI001CB8989A|nr:uncharacterized protein LOC122604302 [Erigeron canadensis]
MFNVLENEVGENDNVDENDKNDEDDNGDANKNDGFQQVFADSKEDLYEGCKKYSKLSAVLRLFNVKANHNWSDKSFKELLKVFHDMLPVGNKLPVSLYEAKKMLCPMGMEMERIAACPNDCVLYRNQYKDLHECPKCGASRYERKKQTKVSGNVTKNGPPAKVLWYFPIIPRLKRLFASPKDAKLLRWHEEERKKDGKLRHVVDSPQWRNIDHTFDEFRNEIRNIRFGLSSYGINPFGNMSSRHSTWPVLLCIYNLPPWLCMKRKYIMMSLFIQGPKQPGNKIDVYLSPLIDNLKTLWSPGVQVYDGYLHENFRLRAMIFCTISDFPAYGNLSGCDTKGAKACPICHDYTCSRWLKYCKKTVYMGHRRSLPPDHPYRNMDNLFDGYSEFGSLPLPSNGETVFSQVENFQNEFGKKRKRGKSVEIWKKRSIFWDLPYWKDLQVRHCIDVMHIEKNVCDSLIGLLLNIPGKTKDGVNARKDMVDMKIRPEIAPQENSDGKRTDYLHGSKSIGLSEGRHEGRLAGVGTIGKKEEFPSKDYMHQAHYTVLQHMTCIGIYVHEHKRFLKTTNRNKSDKFLAVEHYNTFASWLKDKISNLVDVDEEVKRLAYGPSESVTKYQGYDINGYTFYMKQQDAKSTLQNSGVTLIATTTGFPRGRRSRRILIMVLLKKF